MRRFSVLLAAALLSACSHSAAPQIAPQSPLVPLILQTGTPPLQWAQILTNEPAGETITAIARDPNGNEWFTEEGTAGSFVGYVTMSRSMTEFPFSGNAISIVAGPDGNMWFTNPQADEIDRITPAGGITRYQQSTGVDYICNGPDGNLWFTGGSNVVRLTTAGIATAFAVSAQGPCHKGSDGRVWFGGYDQNGHWVGAIDPTTGATSFYAVPSTVRSITSGPDGNIWIGLNITYGSPTTGSIGKMTMGGALTVYQLATGESAFGMVSGPDGNLWFAGSRGIGEITTAGVVVGWHPDPQLPKGVALTGISAGSDGNLWVATGSNGIYYETAYAAIDVFIHRVLTATPSPVVLTAGTSTTLAIKETHYNGSFTVTSADPSIATASMTSRTTYTVSGLTHGSTTLTIADKYQNSLVIGVTVN